MNPDPDDLIRRVLDAEAAKVDTARLWAGVQRRLADDAPTHAQPKPTRRAIRVSALLASLAAAVALGLTLWPARQVAASPAELIAAVRADLDSPQDRSFSFTLEMPAETAAAHPFLARLARPRTLTLRGRSFTLNPGLAESGWMGRDDRDRLWLAASPMSAARFNTDELPPRLRELLEVLDLEVPKLLGEVLRDFDVTEAAAEPGRRTIVAAKQRAGGRTDRVDLTTDDRNALVRLRWTRTLASREIVLQLHRIEDDRPTLTSDPAASMDPAATIHDRDRPLQRRRAVVAQFGEAIFQGN